MRYDSEHKARTHAQVVKAAARAIRQDGPDKISVAGIMDEVGLTHGGFYAHFRSKQDLVAAALDEMFDQASRRFLLTTAERSAESGLAVYVDFYLTREHRDNRGGGCPVAALSADMPRLDSLVRDRYARGVTALTGRIADLLRRLGRASPEDLAASVVAELVGALALARAEPDPERSDQILRASRAALKHRLSLDPSALPDASQNEAAK